MTKIVDHLRTHALYRLVFLNPYEIETQFFLCLYILVQMFCDVTCKVLICASKIVTFQKFPF